jgi:SulP family sulfate permease
MYNLETLCKSAKKEKIQIILSGVIDSVGEKLKRSKVVELVGEENICANIHLAVERAIVVNEEIIEKKRRKLKSL